MKRTLTPTPQKAAAAHMAAGMKPLPCLPFSPPTGGGFQRGLGRLRLLAAHSARNRLATQDNPKRHGSTKPNLRLLSAALRSGLVVLSRTQKKPAIPFFFSATLRKSGDPEPVFFCCRSFGVVLRSRRFRGLRPPTGSRPPLLAALADVVVSTRRRPRGYGDEAASAPPLPAAVAKKFCRSVKNFCRHRQPSGPPRALVGALPAPRSLLDLQRFV